MVRWLGDEVKGIKDLEVTGNVPEEFRACRGLLLLAAHLDASQITVKNDPGAGGRRGVRGMGDMDGRPHPTQGAFVIGPSTPPRVSV